MNQSFWEHVFATAEKYLSSISYFSGSHQLLNIENIRITMHCRQEVVLGLLKSLPIYPWRVAASHSLTLLPVYPPAHHLLFPDLHKMNSLPEHLGKLTTIISSHLWECQICTFSSLFSFADVLKELDDAYERYRRESDSLQRRKLQLSIQRALIRSQELGDEKIQIAGQMVGTEVVTYCKVNRNLAPYQRGNLIHPSDCLWPLLVLVLLLQFTFVLLQVELVENRTRQIDWHSQLLLSSQEVPESHVPTTTSMTTSAASMMSSSSSTITPGKTSHHDKKRDEVTPGSAGGDKAGGKRSRRQKNGETRESYGGMDHSDEVSLGASREKRAKTSSKKKKRSKGKSEREVSPPDLPIDPDEPTYCLCEQVSYGEMIGCDNDECSIEWFHFSCVGLHHKPKGKWYCPKCRGENEKTMDKALERAKKERAYNR